MWRSIDPKGFDYVLYPTNVIVVTAESGGKSSGMVAAWWTPISLDPPLLGVSISPERFTYRLIVESGKFGVNIMDFRHVDKLPYLGDVSGRFYADKLTKAGFSLVRGDKLGVVLIGEASAALELRLDRIIELGDHDLVVGLVEAVYVSRDFDEVWKLEEYEPILYLGRSPDKAKRMFISVKGRRAQLPIAPGELEEVLSRRSQVMRRVRELLKGVKSRDEAVKILEKHLDELGIEREDLAYYARWLVR